MTTLRAAEKFDKSHLSSPQVAPLIDAAKLFYVEGYFLTHGSESALELSKKASESSKVCRPSVLSQERVFMRIRPCPDLRPEPFGTIHPPVLRCPTAADPSLHRYCYLQRD